LGFSRVVIPEFRAGRYLEHQEVIVRRRLEGNGLSGARSLGVILEAEHAGPQCECSRPAAAAAKFR